MGLRDLPQTYDGYLRAARRLRAEHSRPARQAARRRGPPCVVAPATAPWRSSRSLRVTIALTDASSARRSACRAGPAGLGRSPAARPAHAHVAAAAGPPARRPPPLQITGLPPRRLGPPLPDDPTGPTPPEDPMTLQRRVDPTSRSTRTSARPPAPSSSARSCPTTTQWEKDGIVDREVWRKAGRGRAALLRRRRGVRRRRGSRTSATTWSSPRRSARAGASGLGLPGAHRHHRPLHQPASATEEQKQRWLPGLVCRRDRSPRSR